MRNNNKEKEYVTIKSIKRARLLLLIYQNGVLPADHELIAELIDSTNVDLSQEITFVNNAIKKLKNAGLIKMIKLYKRKYDPPHYKDTYILTKK